MTWNYRVIEFQSGDEIHRAIHEVYYDEAGKPNGYTENPASVFWNADEDPGAASKILEKMQVALTKPVLTEKDFTVPADFMAERPLNVLLTERGIFDDDIRPHSKEGRSR